MDIGLIFGLLLAFIVVTLVVVQIQMRKQHYMESPLAPDVAVASVSRSVGGGEAFFDAAGDLSIPFRDGILSVAVEPAASGSRVHVWLSQYNFFNANGFQALAYNGRVSKIRRAVQAA